MHPGYHRMWARARGAATAAGPPGTTDQRPFREGGAIHPGMAPPASVGTHHPPGDVPSGKRRDPERPVAEIVEEAPRGSLGGKKKGMARKARWQGGFSRTTALS